MKNIKILAKVLFSFLLASVAVGAIIPGLLACWLSATTLLAAPHQNQLNKREIKQESYTPFAIGVVQLENGIGTIKHPKLDWDSIPVFSLYYTETPTPGAIVIVCWAVSGLMQICSYDANFGLNTNDNSVYSFAIYDGKAPGVILLTPK